MSNAKEEWRMDGRRVDGGECRRGWIIAHNRLVAFTSIPGPYVFLSHDGAKRKTDEPMSMSVKDPVHQ